MAALSGEIPVYVTNGRRDNWTERRRRVRMQVHWPLRFLKRGNVDALKTVTRDLSSEGFQCLTKVPFVPGEVLVCSLGVPTNDPKDAHKMVQVECNVRIVWARAAEDGFYRIGGRIENYRFLESLPHDQGTARQDQKNP